ncbi:MAG: hypothetical protein SGI87_01980 [Flavobacteriales bacterium]|nr:hypothetical protein [Flavobacteriales bacterium]
MREKKKLTFIIHQKIERWQEALLVAWFAAWAYCGMVFTYYLITTTSSSEKFMFGICVAVWLYFFIRIGIVILWRLGGREIITVLPGEIHIKNAFWKRGKNQIFLMPNIFKLGLIKKSPTNFFAFLDQSFWVLGGERIGFSYSGRRLQFGKQLSENDAAKLTRMVEHAISEFGKISR